MTAVTFSEIVAANARIAPHIHRTPLTPSAALSERFGQTVLLKKEHQQITGSFKLRGATNAVLSLDAAGRERGVCAASTGNHGRALSHAARATGTRAIICMSSLVPANKVAAIKALGAEARIVGHSQDEAQKEVDRLVAEEHMSDIPPFDHRDVIAGQGTLGFEIASAAPELEAVLVPLSGGGLIAGVALAVKTMSPGTRIIGISMERGAAMAASLSAGSPVDVAELDTLADSLGGGIGLSNAHTFRMVRALVDDVVLLTEAEIAAGIAHAYFDEAEVLEGAGAVPIAALLCGKVRLQGPTALVLSGKNIDTRVHLDIVSGTHPACKAEPTDA